VASNIGQKGWLKLQNRAETKYYELFVERFWADPIWEQEFIHTPDRGHYTLPMGVFWFEFNAVNIWLTKNLDAENIMKDLIDWQDDQYYYLSFYKTAAKAEIKFDGVNTRYKVAALPNGIKQLEKISNGDTEGFRIATARWTEAG